MKRGFSIILCCYNSADLLPQTLKGLASLEVPPGLGVELLVIDNASTDQTAAIAKASWEDSGAPYSLTIYQEPVAGLSYARKTGIRKASYEYLLFCDDDNWLAADYLTVAEKLLNADPGIGMLGGNGEGISQDPIPGWTSAFQLFGCGPQAAQTGKAEALYGAGMILCRSAFRRLEAAEFDFQLTDRKGLLLSSGGDYELSYAIRLAGYQVWYSADLHFKHYIRPSRLTFGYYKKYVRETAGSNDILSIYLQVLKHPGENFGYYFFRQVWQGLHHLKTLLVLGFPLVFYRVTRGRSSFGQWIPVYYHAIRIFQVFGFIPKSRKYFSAIKKLKQQLNDLPANGASAK